jgi:hypothetical protein
MSDIAILKDMIKDIATVSLENRLEGRREKYSVTLKEPQDDYFVQIDEMPNPDEVIVIKSDTFIASREVFEGSKGECKRADFVIIANTNTEKVILCIEMKAGQAVNKSIIQQLKGAQCFVVYCQKIGQLFWNQPSFLSNYKYRFVSIKRISMSKKTTRPSRKIPIQGSKVQIHDHPDRMLKISSPHRLKFNHLV